MSTSPEEFQRQLIQALEGLDGIMHIFDDTLVFNVGESQDEAVCNHDAKLRALFERCCTKGTNLNKDKLKLRLPEVAFMSHVISREGLKPDPAYVQGIQEMPDPREEAKREKADENGQLSTAVRAKPAKDTSFFERSSEGSKPVQLGTRSTKKLCRGEEVNHRSPNTEIL